jgi:uncharacterized membrane protein YkvI
MISAGRSSAVTKIKSFQDFELPTQNVIKPIFHLRNEIMRLILWLITFSTEVVLLFLNKIEIKFNDVHICFAS